MKANTYISVGIGDKAYEYPNSLPIPSKGDSIRIGDSVSATVTHIHYSIIIIDGKNISNSISILTDK